MSFASGLSNNPFLASNIDNQARYPDVNSIQSAGYAAGGAQYGSIGGSALGGSLGYSGGYQQQPSSLGVPTGGSWQTSPSFLQTQSPSPSLLGAQPGNYTGYGQYSIGAQATGLPLQGGGYAQSQQYLTQQPQQQAQAYGQGYGALPQIAQPTGYATNGLGYGGYTQQPQSNRYLSEFDPYAQQQQQQQQLQTIQTIPYRITYLYQAPQQSSLSPNPTGAPKVSIGPNGQQHPREMVRTHKVELERWDQYNWKQLLNSFEDLGKAWGTRRDDIKVYLTQNAIFVSDQDRSRLQMLLREAEQNIDHVAASTIQMQEVQTGYRQSGDLASKTRVRDSMNAALRGLPDWPQ